MCEDAAFERPDGYVPPSNRWDWARFDPSNGGAHCNNKQGEEGCKVELSRPIAFKTGRRDCIPKDGEGYWASKEEWHPDPFTNGRGTVEFFKRDFGFSGRETVAIMGSHTMGRLHQGTTMLPYVWIKSGGQQFNNQYYRNLVGKPDWYFVHDSGTGFGCERLGDGWGQKPLARWLTNTRLHLTSGGPTFWIQEKLVCNDFCARGDNKSVSEVCCSNSSVPSGGMCTPDGGRDNTTSAADADPNVESGCERYKFHSGLDECMLNAEMGLYKDFQVTADGIPHGCPGFENFNLENWRKTWRAGTTFESHWSMIDGRRAEPQCEKMTLEEPPGSTPLHQIIEDYADHQENWIRDFVPTFEKLISNGYTEEELEDGPDQWTGITCPRQLPEANNKQWAIWSEEGLSNPFFLVSKLDSRVLQINETTGGVEVSTHQNKTNQMWQWTDEGGMLVNSFSKSLLMIDGRLSWSLENATQDGALLSSVNYKGEVKVVDRGWTQKDGATAGIYEGHGAANQRWTLEMVPTPAPTSSPTSSPATPTTTSPTEGFSGGLMSTASTIAPALSLGIAICVCLSV